MAALASATPVVRAFTAQPRLPVRAGKAQKVIIRATAADHSAVKDALVKATTFGSLAGSFLAAGNAQAAMEVANIAAGDNRAGVIAALALPVLGWVGFNMAGPVTNQFKDMEARKRSVAIGLGAATLLAAGSADAATEAMQLAASDNRLGVLASLFVPVIGWVGFNIAQPFFNQLDAMNAKKGKAVAAGLGLGAASLLAAGGADAATEAMQLAASDNRLGVLASLFVPVIGWVGFNIAQPFFNQLDAMNAKKGKAVAAGLGLGAASLLAAGGADAATEAMQLAASDNRLGVLASLFVPVIGWVGFNIAQPFFNQLDAMNAKKGKAVAAGLGLGAASLLAAGGADAATEAMQLAASDNRLGVLASLFVPVIGWVGFNIAQPFFNQLDAMNAKKGGK